MRWCSGGGLTPRLDCLTHPFICPSLLPPFCWCQVISEVGGGAHLVLHARLRHAPAASKAATHALKVVLMRDIRQIQREVRGCTAQPAGQ